MNIISTAGIYGTLASWNTQSESARNFPILLVRSAWLWSVDPCSTVKFWTYNFIFKINPVNVTFVTASHLWRELFFATIRRHVISVWHGWFSLTIITVCLEQVLWQNTRFVLTPMFTNAQNDVSQCNHNKDWLKWKPIDLRYFCTKVMFTLTQTSG